MCLVVGASMETTHVSAAALKELALEAHLAARRSVATPSDTLLAAQMGSGPTGFRNLSNSEFNNFVHCATLHQTPRSDEGTGAREARCTFSAQFAGSATVFVTSQHNASIKALPGGVPLVDHVAAAASTRPDWKEVENVADYMANRRIPLEEDLAHMREITIGKSSPEQIEEVGYWMLEQRNKEETTLMFSLPAADTESVPVFLEGTCGNKERLAKLREQLERDLDFLVLKVAQPEQPAVNLPTAFIVGGDTWMLYIRLPVSVFQGKVYLNKGVYHKEIDWLFQQIGTAIGSGIRQDYEEWCDVVTSLYRESKIRESMAAPIELEWLLRLAGVSSHTFGLKHVLWLVFGVVVPKSRTSLGDRKWGVELKYLPEGLKMYLLSDTTLVARAAWVLIAAWCMHALPDAAMICQQSTMTSGRMLKWVFAKVVRNMLPELSKTSQHPMLKAHLDLPTTRGELLDALELPVEADYDFLAINPDWPSITAGWVRCLSSARARMLSFDVILRPLDHVAFPALLQSDRELLIFGRSQAATVDHPSDPVESHEWTLHPSIEQFLQGDPDQITIASFEFCDGVVITKRRAILEYVCCDPARGAALLKRIDHSKTFALKVYGAKHLTKCVVELRKVLATYGYKEDYSDRKDPYRVDEYTRAKEIKILTHSKSVISKRTLIKRVSTDDPNIDRLEVSVQSMERETVPDKEATMMVIKACLGPPQKKVRLGKISKDAVDFVRTGCTTQIMRGWFDKDPVTLDSREQPKKAPFADYEDVSEPGSPRLDQIERDFSETDNLIPVPETKTTPHSEGWDDEDSHDSPAVFSSHSVVEVTPKGEWELKESVQFAELGGLELTQDEIDPNVSVREGASAEDGDLHDTDLELEINPRERFEEDVSPRNNPPAISEVRTVSYVDMVKRSPRKEVKEEVQLVTMSSVHVVAFRKDGKKCERRHPFSFLIGDMRPDGSALPRIPDEKLQALINALALQKSSFNFISLTTLQPDAWIDDTVVDGYMELIEERSKASNTAFHAFSSYFISSVRATLDSESQRWDKHRNIFKFTTLLIPVHQINHWYLMVYDVKKNRIGIFDSTVKSLDNYDEDINILVTYLKIQHIKRTGSELAPPHQVVIDPKRSPQQENGVDCGVFMCVSAEFIARGKTPRFKQADIAYFRLKIAAELLDGKLLPM